MSDERMPDKSYGTFSEVRKRLDEIVVEVRDKNLSLEKSLDLYEEAIALGNRAAELVDKSDYTVAEARAAEELISGEAPELSLSGEQMKQTGAETDAVAFGDQDKPASNQMDELARKSAKNCDEHESEDDEMQQSTSCEQTDVQTIKTKSVKQSDE